MADFTVKPDLVFNETIEFNTLISNFENGVEQRRAVTANSRRTWKLHFKNRTSTDFTTVRDFFIAKYGQTESFTWENLNDSTEYTVRYKENSLQFQKKSAAIYDFECTFIEVL